MPDLTFLASYSSDIITCIVDGARNGGELDRFYFSSITDLQASLAIDAGLCQSLSSFSAERIPWKREYSDRKNPNMSIHNSPGSPARGTIPPTRLIAYSVALAALAVALSPISIPIGIAKVSPTQHFINVIAGALVGPWWGLAVALVTSLIRNAIGLGTPLAFPGSVFGVVLAGAGIWLQVSGARLLRSKAP